MAVKEVFGVVVRPLADVAGSRIEWKPSCGNRPCNRVSVIQTGDCINFVYEN